jgi:hypothetical protein
MQTFKKIYYERSIMVDYEKNFVLKTRLENFIEWFNSLDEKEIDIFLNAIDDMKKKKIFK